MGTRRRTEEDQGRGPRTALGFQVPSGGPGPVHQTLAPAPSTLRGCPASNPQLRLALRAYEQALGFGSPRWGGDRPPGRIEVQTTGFYTAPPPPQPSVPWDGGYRRQTTLPRGHKSAGAGGVFPSASGGWESRSTPRGEEAVNPVMILPQVHLRKPCYDFYFL